MRNPGLTHIAHENIRNVPCGPLPLRSSGICPDANAQGLRTAHQFASLLMRNPGLTHIAHENIRNVPCGPLPLRSSGICPDANAQGLRTAH